VEKNNAKANSFFDRNTEKIVAISAIIVSICALGVSILQTKIMQTQQEKAAWPHIRWYTQTGWEMDSTGTFKITVTNKGIGPALIKKVEIVLDSYRYTSDSIENVLRKMYNGPIGGVSQINFNQTVMLPNDAVDFFEFTDKRQAFEFAKIYNNVYETSEKFDIIIHYEDVYGNAFVSSRSSKF
jgi:hypothetical protein